MCENIPPNVLPKKLIQTKLTSYLKTKPKTEMTSTTKKQKTEVIEIDDSFEAVDEEVNPSVATNSDNAPQSDPDICETTDPNISEMPLEVAMDLIEECLESSVSVNALKTVEELEKDNLEMGLGLNKDCYDEEVDDSYIDSHTYEVESIHKSRVEEDKSVVYWVKWKNYSMDDNTWEPLSNLTNCRQLLDEFKHITKTNDENLMTVYHNYYKLKGIIEDICERKMDLDVMTAVLLVFFNVRLKDFQYTKVMVNGLRAKIRDDFLSIIDEISVETKVDKRLNKINKNFNEMTERLNILKRFENFDNFYEFFTKRKLIQQKLKKWENEVNHIIIEEREGKTIELENFVDCEVPPHNFKYISANETNDPKIVINDDPPIFCQSDHCCEDKLSDCCVSSNQSVIGYTKNSMLRDSRNRTAIYECNRKCKCDQMCMNRVVQKGRKHRLAIFKTDDDKGWGVRTLEPIHKGSFVMEYIGEIITIEEADKRGAVYDAEGRTYLFDLDFTSDEDKETFKYSLDATQCGNISHFVNHSCEPNLDSRCVWINNLDPHMPHIVFFAVRNIRVNEELTYDYKINVHGNTESKDSSNNDECIPRRRVTTQQVFCRCGAPNCRGFLYTVETTSTDQKTESDVLIDTL